MSNPTQPNQNTDSPESQAHESHAHQPHTHQPQREVRLRFLAEPTDINFGGKAHGGMVMKWIDQAAYVCASGWSGRYCVTVYVGGIRFYKPIFIGALVEVWARVIYTGNTSMHLAVDVWSRDPRENQSTKTTHCVIIFVALDDEGRPVAVPRWEPQRQEDRRLEEYARKLMDLRQGIEEEMQAFLVDNSAVENSA